MQGHSSAILLSYMLDMRTFFRVLIKYQANTHPLVNPTTLSFLKYLILLIDKYSYISLCC